MGKLITGTSAAETLNGTAEDDTINGGAGNDVLTGGAGNDTLNGEAGNDSLQGGLGDDVLVAGLGKDTVDGGDGSDTLQLAKSLASYSIKRISNTETTLTEGVNVITVRNLEAIDFNGDVRSTSSLWGSTPSAFNDKLQGTDGADSLDGQAGADTLIGGLGNDTYAIDNLADLVVEAGNEGRDLVKLALTAAGTYSMADGTDDASVTAAAAVAVNVTGNALDNSITGNAAANTLAGGAGNDILDGGAGADKLIGGVGDDLYIVGDAGDVITENLNEGSDTVKTGLASYNLAANVENLQYTGSAVFTGTGNALDNVIIGGNKGNKLDGGAGNDSLSGGDGSDTLIGGIGNDTFVASAGKDTVEGGEGTDVLQGLGKFADYSINRPNATDTVLTKDGNQIVVRGVDTFVFSDGSKSLAEVLSNASSFSNDSLTGTDGADLIDGGQGADTLAGGKGDDTYVIDNVNDVVQELSGGGKDLVQVAFAAAATYKLADNVEDAKVTAAAGVAVNLSGNELDNALTGNAAANSLLGDDGNDTLDGGAGADKLVGGNGNDVYVVDNAGDVITENPGEGSDTVRTSLASYTLGANLEELRYIGSALFTGTGSADDNVLSGGNNGNKLDGRAGNDSLSGGQAADTLTGGAGNDTLVGSAGKDSVDGGADDDTLTFSGNFADYTVSRSSATETVLNYKNKVDAVTVRNVEVFHFADGDKSLDQVQYNVSSAFNDTLTGGSGNDSLDGLGGADTLIGGIGNDTYVIDNLGDVVLESDAGDGGVDLLQIKLAAAGTYKMAEFVEKATITAVASVAVDVSGNDWDNYITGNAAANTLRGEWGNDTLDGGAGNDKLLGGGGNDVYVVSDSGDLVTEQLDEGYDKVEASVASYVLTANVEQLEYRGTAKFTGTGNVLDNLIQGGNGGATLDGLAGNDTLQGGNGNDTLQGGAGEDLLQAGKGKDIVDGGADYDVLNISGKFADYSITRPTAGDIMLDDGKGNVLTVRNVELFRFADGDRLPGEVQFNVRSAYDDVLVGSSGNDTLNGGAGADTMAGGLGDDTYVIDNLRDVVEETGENLLDTVELALTAAGTYLMAENVEVATVTAATSVAVNVTGNGSDNLITGNAAANTLSGDWGNDTLDGGAGNDKLLGGLGDDLYLVRDSGDLVVEQQDEGYDKVQASVASYTLTANVEQLEYTGSAVFSGTGNALDNVIIGGNYGAKLDGGVGNDTLFGGNGADTLQGGLGDDVLEASGGKDVIDGGDGSDLLRGLGNLADYSFKHPTLTDVELYDKNGKLLMTVHTNVEWLDFADGTRALSELLVNVASPGGDLMIGGAGQDTLDGFAGADTMRGGDGNDLYMIDNVGDQIEEEPGAGFDTAQVNLTAAVTFKLADQVENAVVTSGAAINLTGNDIDNWLTGNAVANTLAGGAGNDTLDGGAGSDKLLGGIGDDLYLLNDADVVTELADEGYDIVKTTLASYALTANVEELIYTGSGTFSGTGNAQANVITGGSGNDSLLGGAGDDTLSGMHGKDTLDGGAGQDTVMLDWVSRDQVKVERTTATDTVLTDHDGNSVTLRNVELVVFSNGTASIDELQYNIGSPGADHLVGTDGIDLLNGGAGADTLEGFGGDDVYVIADKAAVVLEADAAGHDTVQVAFTAAATYTLADNVEDAVVTAAASVAANLSGNALANWLTGNAAANVLTGGAGNDTLDGGAGADKLAGGLGDDRYVVSDSGDTVTEQAGEGFDTVMTTLASYTLGANVEAVIYLGAGSFTGTGNAGINLLSGGDGGARLDGGAGDDFLIGGNGNDNLQGGLGDDVIATWYGKDTVDGGAGNDTLDNLDDRAYYNVERLNATDIKLRDVWGDTVIVRNVELFNFNGSYYSLDGLLTNSVGPGSDTVYGSSGNDVLDGGAGDDALIGGYGNDLYILSSPGDQILEWAGFDTARLEFSSAATYTLADGVERAVVSTDNTLAVNVIGNDLDNFLYGNGGANSLSGGLGNDVLDGGAGNDVLAGGAGDDQYSVGETADVIKENLNEGNDTVFVTAAAYTLSANIEDMVFKGTGAFTGTGNSGNNRLFAGSSSGAKLDGGAGNDLLVGALGNDSLAGGVGDDSIQASGGSDTVDGGAGNDVLYELDLRDYYAVSRLNATDVTLTHRDGTIYTVRGVETFYFGADKWTLAQVQANTAGTGNDSVSGTAGDDMLDGGAGADTLSGGIGDDTYVIDNSSDRIIEASGEGQDKVLLALTSAATYTLDSGVEDVQLISAATLAVNVTGNALGNHITGNAGANKLAGGAGADTLDGAAGNDTLTGGTDADTFVISTLDGSKTITDFVSGTDHVALDLNVQWPSYYLDGSVHTGPGRFDILSELVLFTQKMTTASTANAAAIIGSASIAYSVGDVALFAVSTAADTTVYRFVSKGADALVSADELTALVTLTGTPTVTLDDFLFAGINV
jgi:Ca2+-binding RTX toxin-like protein